MDSITPKDRQEMEAAKEMIARDDHISARDKLLKLQQQFPTIEEFSSMITVCDVLNSASIDLIPNQSDWYLILQVPQEASQQDVEYQYNKISNLLKLIKTNIPAAESAREIIEEAYSVLSNLEKRIEFDQKRNSMLGAFSEGSVNFAAIMPSNSSLSFKSLAQGDFGLNGIQSSEIFKVGQVWAAYDHECMPRNYLRIQKIEKNPLRLHVHSLKGHKLSSHEVLRSETGFPIVCGRFNVDKSKDQIIVPAVLSHVVRNYADHDEELLIFPKEQEVWAIYKELDHMIRWSNGEAMKRSNLEVVEIVTGYTESGNMLVARLVKVDGDKNVFRRQKKNCKEQFLPIPSDNLYKLSHRIPAHRIVGEDNEGMFELDPYAVPIGLDNPQSVTSKARSDSASKSFDPENKLSLKDSSCNLQSVASKARSYSASTSIDPENKLSLKDFSCNLQSLANKARSDSASTSFDTENKLSLKKFSCKQIWAVCDDVAAIPRRYVVVNNVAPKGEICVTFLDPIPTCIEEKSWMERGLPFGCGSFSAGKTTRILESHHFSHVMKGEQKQEDSVFMIYPHKGEVWARYKNWSGKWDESDLSCSQYQIVEVVSDLDDGSEIVVISLVEMPGFMTLFQRQHNNVCEWIPRAEFLSFSHRIVASCIVSKDNGVSAPFWQVEPDSLDSLNLARSHKI